MLQTLQPGLGTSSQKQGSAVALWKPFLAPKGGDTSGCQSAVFQGEGCGAGPLGQRLQGPHTPVALELASSLLLASSIPLHQELTGVKLAECHWPHSGHPPHQ